MKTGFTNEAGYNLVGSAVQNGVRLIVVVTGLKNAKDRADDAKKLLDYGFKNFDARILFAEGQNVAEAKVYGGAQGRVAVAAKGTVKLMVPRGVSDKIIAKLVYTGPVRAPVREGQADRQSAGLARRRQSARSAGPGIRKRCRRLDLATRHRCRVGTCDQLVSLCRQTDISRRSRPAPTGGSEMAKSQASSG